MELGASIKLVKTYEVDAMLKPDRYVIHIYRRAGSGRRTRVAGLLEKVGNGTQQKFSNAAELWSLLTALPKKLRGVGNQRDKP